jgi:uncharacterized repeat protein (TIGR03803 family)
MFTCCSTDRPWKIRSSHGARGSTLAALVLVVVCGMLTVCPAQTYTVLHFFRGTSDGEFPVAGLIQDAAGNLYGTAARGTNAGPAGTLFKVTPEGKFKVLHTFGSGLDGIGPSASLLIDALGDLFGTTVLGGTFDRGTVFEYSASGVYSVLYDFTGGADGGLPYAPLILDDSGNLLGTASAGGSTANCGNGCGVVFKLDASGQETVLHTFAEVEFDLAGGIMPLGGLYRDPAGNLFGTAELGGDLFCDPGGNGCGVVFKVDANGKESVFHTFEYRGGNAPWSALVPGPDGRLYGTTTVGGVQGIGPPPGACGFEGCGVVYRLGKHGQEKVIYRFKGGLDGDVPVGGVSFDAAGNLYGAALQGSTNCDPGLACGEVFRIDPSGNFTVLHSFGAPAGPWGGVLVGLDGSLYGTTNFGGSKRCGGSGCGVVFKITP